ncbi:Na+/H+ antiporter subunit E [Bartonella tamiae]|uniref:Na+/H+ antiporter subunit E n=1 Tax=Bartonella tamiae Th239 TaxID=1094558 RepID=J1K284_9HYPH|nr:Na+/H+ antiporter subunit E [Bartonella tamiae]EJF91587.1 hypothetical protein ME5_00282 [Bartonella tamiae Th239]EJF92429.1 hypothetical protein MEG_01599 [Bartonella tamiae Th307]
MTRILPYPLLTVSIFLMWLMLSGFTIGQGILGLGVGCVAGLIMSRLKPEKMHIKNWFAIIQLFFIVLWDVTLSNLSVARLALFGERKGHGSGFIIVSLDMTSPTGLAILGCVMTATPGTAWVSYDSKNSELLVHVLDLHDEKYWQDLIKHRYEALLLEIFR